jgi:hypothetical protein
MCKLRQRGQGYGGRPAGSRGIYPSLQPLPAVAAREFNDMTDFTLTTGSDTVIGTAGNDTVNGTAAILPAELMVTLAYLAAGADENALSRQLLALETQTPN